MSEAVGHALSHLALFVPVAVVGLLVRRRRRTRRTTAPAPWGRRLAFAGWLGFLTGQALEIAGARVDEPDATTAEEIAHTAGMVVTNLSVPLLVAGAALVLVAAARDGAVPRWVAAAVVVGLVALAGVMFIGAPGA